MTNPKVALFVTASMATAAIVSSIAPAHGQDRGGLTTEFSINNSIETTRNPSLTPGNTDIRTVIGTDLGFSVFSQTQRSQIEFLAGGTLRYSTGDVSAADEGLTFGSESLGLNYSAQAPRAQIDARLSYSREDLSFINAADLITDDDGTVTVDPDFANVSGLGTRENISYALGASFDENRPFGWGAGVSGTDLNYSDVSSATLNDSSTFNANLNAHFDLTSTLRVDTQLGYAGRRTDTLGTSSTTSLNIAATATRSDNFSVRGGLNFAIPDGSDDRVSLTGGFTVVPSAISQLSVDAGVTLSDAFDTQFTGRLSYTLQPTSTTRVNVQLNTNVTDSIDNETVVDTTAIVGVDFELTPVSSLSFDAIYAQEKVLATDDDVSELSASIQLNRELTRDWQLSVGASQTNRWETGADSASSEELFVSIGRTWNGRF